MAKDVPNNQTPSIELNSTLQSATNLNSVRRHKREISPYEERSKSNTSKINSYEELNERSKSKRALKIASTRSRTREIGNPSPQVYSYRHKKPNKPNKYSNIVIEKSKRDRNILNDFKSFIQSGNSELSQRRESSRYNLPKQPASKTQLGKVASLLTRNIPMSIGKSVGVDNKTNKSSIIAERPMKFRKSTPRLEFLNKDRTPPRPKDQMKFALMDSSLGLTPDPVPRSKRKIFDKSSGVYGNFSVMDSLDKSIGMLNKNRNR
eukprot:CAMPEP_0197012136 /NCGR_PEP_ID=MMETSP1380-20130617/61396_1 /TAXON_ID=5936 /ORGANISM="Euplotes crassus, Strain CT5" /LENGTH=262 /DNA_ID=CAMNT_0042435389 /DNA_START=46 /DNA_END=831 /DNA_ORIENTATION=-